MAVDKLVDSTQLDADLTSVANAIRTKGGTSAQLAFPADFVSAIGDIPTGGYTPVNTTLTFQNSSNSAGALSITWAGLRPIGSVCPIVWSAVSLAKGGTRTCNNNILLYDGAVGLLVNNEVTSVTYNGNPLAFDSQVSGSYRYMKIVLPDGFDNSYDIVLTRS